MTTSLEGTGSTTRATLRVRGRQYSAAHFVHPR